MLDAIGVLAARKIPYTVIDAMASSASAIAGASGWAWMPLRRCYSPGLPWGEADASCALRHAVRIGTDGGYVRGTFAARAVQAGISRPWHGLRGLFDRAGARQRLQTGAHESRPGGGVSFMLSTMPIKRGCKTAGYGRRHDPISPLPEVAVRYRHLAFPVAVLSLASLAACTSAPPASRANFSDVLAAALGRRCITVSPFLGAGGPYPANVCGLSFADTHQLDALAKAGLLTRSTGCVYSLTAAGRKALQAPVGGAFCAGHYKLDKLLGWTKPHPNFMYGGKKTSEVTFTYSPADMAPWARTAAVSAAFATLEELAPQRKARATLVQEHDGWSVRGLRI